MKEASADLRVEVRGRADLKELRSPVYFRPALPATVALVKSLVQKLIGLSRSLLPVEGEEGFDVKAQRIFDALQAGVDWVMAFTDKHGFPS